jgi:hypothetical protein
MTAEEGSETRKRKEVAAGKSETCRTSAWQSHHKEARLPGTMPARIGHLPNLIL